jgi:beta-glucosidase/6-phospho-beta-glucosidase/beta-galactosidase
MGWELYPRGLGIVLSEFARFGVPLFVTENGIATEDDRLRCTFLTEHLEQIARALREGLEVLGYLHWTMMDNFEWNLGTGPKFGLAAVDPQTGARSPRLSAALLAQICRDHRIPVTRND